jgi:hypothetical protein
LLARDEIHRIRIIMSDVYLAIVMRFEAQKFEFLRFWIFCEKTLHQGNVRKIPIRNGKIAFSE